MDPCDITTSIGKKNVSCYQRSVASKQLPVKIKAARLKLKPMILMSYREKKKIHAIHHGGDVPVPQSGEGDDRGAISTGENAERTTRVMR